MMEIVSLPKVRKAFIFLRYGMSTSHTKTKCIESGTTHGILCSDCNISVPWAHILAMHEHQAVVIEHAAVSKHAHGWQSLKINSEDASDHTCCNSSELSCTQKCLARLETQHGAIPY